MGKPINRNIWRYISKKNILGNIYRPPRNTINDYDIFTREFTGALDYLEKGFIPLITFPTRFSDLHGTLIDNFL